MDDDVAGMIRQALLTGSHGLRPEDFYFKYSRREAVPSGYIKGTNNVSIKVPADLLNKAGTMKVAAYSDEGYMAWNTDITLACLTECL